MVEISGHADGAGNIYATLVDVKKASYVDGDEIELKGVIGNLTATTFDIGSQQVDFSEANLNATLQNGALVEIKSTSGFDAMSGALKANTVEVKNLNGREFEGQEGQELELEGLVSKIVANTSITVNGYTVLTGDTTPFTVGDKLEIKGQFDSNGDLTLTEYEQRISSDLEIDGYVTLNLGNQPNQVVLFGQSFVINNQSIMNDERDEGYTPVHYFSINDLSNGDRVEVRAYKNSNNAWIVTRLDRVNDAGDPQIIKGQITSTDGSTTMTIKDNFDIDLATNSVPLNGKTAGDEVEVEVTVSGNTLIATAIN